MSDPQEHSKSPVTWAVKYLGSENQEYRRTEIYEAETGEPVIFGLVVSSAETFRLERMLECRNLLDGPEPETDLDRELRSLSTELDDRLALEIAASLGEQFGWNDAEKDLALTLIAGSIAIVWAGTDDLPSGRLRVDRNLRPATAADESAVADLQEKLAEALQRDEPLCEELAVDVRDPRPIMEEILQSLKDAVGEEPS